MSPEDLMIIEDLNDNADGFILKYANDVMVINETLLDYNADGYALIPDVYYKLSVRIEWIHEKPKIKKYKDGEGRRKRLYIDALKMRAIKPDVTFLELLYNLVLRRKFFYDNSDRVLTNRILIEDAQTVLKMNMNDVCALYPSKHGTFKTDAVYCSEHGVSRRSHSRTVRKWLNHQSIGEWYDVSKSVNWNYKYAQANDIKTGLNTLKDFCWENGIDMHPERKPIGDWYDETLSVK